jgi:hypothetical protein
MTALTVFYNDEHQIVALAGADPDTRAAVQPGSGIHTATLELTSEQAGLSAVTLLTQFRVELGTPRLVPIVSGPAAAADETPAEPEPIPTRYEAMVLTSSTRLALADVADLDLDRLPDPGGRVRVLVSADEARELTDRGYEVRLLNALKAQPLDPGLVMTDEQAEGWLAARTADIERQEGR